MTKKNKKKSLIVLAIAAVGVPLALIARKLIMKQRAKNTEEEYEPAAVFPAYRGKDKVHNRKDKLEEGEVNLGTA